MPELDPTRNATSSSSRAAIDVAGKDGQLGPIFREMVQAEQSAATVTGAGAGTSAGTGAGAGAGASAGAGAGAGRAQHDHRTGHFMDTETEDADADGVTSNAPTLHTHHNSEGVARTTSHALHTPHAPHETSKETVDDHDSDKHTDQNEGNINGVTRPMGEPIARQMQGSDELGNHWNKGGEPEASIGIIDADQNGPRPPNSTPPTSTAAPEGGDRHDNAPHSRSQADQPAVRKGVTDKGVQET